MKTNKLFLMAAFVCGAAFTSCSNEDNAGSQAYTVSVISFENQKLNSDGYWSGDESGTKYESWGSDAYACKYQEAGVTFNTNFVPAWSSWTGYAISNRTETTYKTTTPDQYNNITGKAYTGKNFCVVQTYGETIDIEGGAYVQGFFYTNNAWTVDAILNGDGMTPGKFEPSDWLKCTVTGIKADGTKASVDIELAANGSYVKDWQWADLSSLGKVVSLSFAFSGTKNNAYGLTTPAYMCIDDLTIMK